VAAEVVERRPRLLGHPGADAAPLPLGEREALVGLRLRFEWPAGPVQRFDRPDPGGAGAEGDRDRGGRVPVGGQSDDTVSVLDRVRLHRKLPDGWSPTIPDRVAKRKTESETALIARIRTVARQIEERVRNTLRNAEAGQSAGGGIDPAVSPAPDET
jgi:hypothetical protein